MIVLLVLNILKTQFSQFHPWKNNGLDDEVLHTRSHCAAHDYA